jgi:hypothetical protein
MQINPSDVHSIIRGSLFWPYVPPPLSPILSLLLIQNKNPCWREKEEGGEKKKKTLVKNSKGGLALKLQLMSIKREAKIVFSEVLFIQVRGKIYKTFYFSIGMYQLAGQLGDATPWPPLLRAIQRSDLGNSNIFICQ